MLYEIALPVLVIGDCCRRLRDAMFERHRIVAVPAGRVRLRAAKCRLRRVELTLLARTAPAAAARLALARFEGAYPAAKPPGSGRNSAGRLATRVLGPEGGASILALHGWNANGATMLPMAEALAARGFRVTVTELPGNRPIGGRMLTFAEKAAALAGTCCFMEPFEAVVAHSAGGLIAAMAAGYGLEAKRLVSVCAPASMATLLGAYLLKTRAPPQLLTEVLHAYCALRGGDPAMIGPKDYARFGGRHLVAHARADWQIRVEEAQQICANHLGAVPLILDCCNHHTILHHPALHAAIAEFITAGASIEAGTC